MAFKTDEQSIKILPEEVTRDGNKTTTTRIVSGLVETNPEVYLKRAEFFESEWMYEQAEKEYDAAVQHSQGIAKYYYRKAKFCMKHGKVRTAIALYMRGIWSSTAFIWLLLLAFCYRESYPYMAVALCVLAVIAFLCGVKIIVWEKVRNKLEEWRCALLSKIGENSLLKLLFGSIFSIIGIVLTLGFTFFLLAAFFLGTPAGPIVGGLCLIAILFYFLRFLWMILRYIFTGKSCILDTSALLAEGLSASKTEEYDSKKKSIASSEIILAFCLVTLIGSCVYPMISERIDAVRCASKEASATAEENMDNASYIFSVNPAYPDGNEGKTPVIYYDTDNSEISEDEEKSLAAEQRPALIKYLGCSEDNLWAGYVTCTQGGVPRIGFWYVDNYEEFSDDLIILLEDGTAAWCVDNTSYEYSMDGTTEVTRITGTMSVNTIGRNAFFTEETGSNPIDARKLSESEQKNLIAEYLGCDANELTYYQTNQAQRMEFADTDEDSDYLVFLLDDGTVAGHYEAEPPLRVESTGDSQSFLNENNSVSFPEISKLEGVGEDSISEVLYSVLSRKEPFINHGYYGDIEEYQYCDAVIDYVYERNYVVTTSFSVVDMDGDGVNDVVLWGYLESEYGQSSVSTVLHEYEGIVYGDMFSQLSMWPKTLSKTGVFRDGWDDYSHCIFNGANCETEAVAYNYNSYYTIGNDSTEVTEEEYNEYLEQLNVDDYAEVYDFIEENILKFKTS